MEYRWHITRDGKQYGPISQAQLDDLAKSGHLQGTDYVWREGLNEWQPATIVLENRHQPTELILGAIQVTKGHEANAKQKAPRGLLAGSWSFWVAVGILFVLLAPLAVLYREGAGLYGALFATIGGALGGAVSFLVERYSKKTLLQSWKIGVVSVGVMLGVGFGKLSEMSVAAGIAPMREVVYEHIAQAKIDRLFVQRTLKGAGDAGRLYLVLEQKEPATFDAIVQVLTVNLRPGAAPDQVIALMREQFIERISKPRMGYLPDDDFLRMFELKADLLKALAATNPPLCLLTAQEKQFGNIRSYLSREIEQREQSLMERLIETQPRQITLASTSELAKVNRKVFAALFKRYGSSIEFLDPTKQIAGQERAACLMNMEYIRTILSLPTSEALSLLRAMVLDPGRLG
jgi:hypothetical protein